MGGEICSTGSSDGPVWLDSAPLPASSVWLLLSSARPRSALATAGLSLSLIGAVWAAGRRHLRGGCQQAGAALLVASILLTGLFSGLLLGTVRVAALEDSALSSHLQETVRVEAVITSPVRVSGGWQSAFATVRRCEADASACGEKVWLELPPEDGVVPLSQGLVVDLRARVEAPEGPSDSGYDQKKWLLQQGVGVVLRVTAADSLVVNGRRSGVAGAFDRLRAAAQQHLSLGPNSRVNEVLQGVVTGDTAGIDDSWLEAFRRSGTAHMLSVSGLHVASLAAIMFGLARLLRLPRGAGFFLAAGAAVLMIPFVGPSPPVVRSVVMIIIVLVGRWVGRGRDQWQILALAAVVILSMNPYALFDVGFQLSFSAFIGMMALGPLLQRVLKRMPEGVAANVAVSVAAGAGTAPVALAQFGRTSLISPVANLLVVPTLPAVTGLGMASVFAGFIWHGLSVAFDTLASLPMMWTVLVSRLMGHAPVLESADVGRAIGALLGGMMMLPVALALTGRACGTPFGVRLPLIRRGLLWIRRRRPKRRYLGAACAAVVVGLGLVMGVGGWTAGEGGLDAVQAALGGRGWPDHVEMRVLDVGQGNAILVRTPQHHALLFDGGPEGCDLAGQLRSLGVRRLDLVVISHPHADHFAGLLEALPELEVGTLVDNVQVTAADSRGPPSNGDRRGVWRKRRGSAVSGIASAVGRARLSLCAGAPGRADHRGRRGVGLLCAGETSSHARRQRPLGEARRCSDRGRTERRLAGRRPHCGSDTCHPPGGRGSRSACGV